ncbi:MAG: filamentous hemagglutinin N-terminal domain-containing protein, partial [Pseudolabrys sp.]
MHFNGFAKRLSCLLAAVLFLAAPAPSVLANPTGGVVVAGSATIGPAGQTLTINQSSANAVINWQQFSIASGELTKFLVPGSSSATLNRVLGGNPSAIYGTLQSNGILYLINPSGIVVGPGGRIDTASFIGSTLDVSNDEFLRRGNLHFLGTSDAAIDNQVTIHASDGDVYLIASQVTNSGALRAPKGEVGLAAGTDVLYAQAGDQHLFIQPTPAGATRALGVTNSGTIRAASAELRAAGGNAYALAINNTGSISASGYKKIGGEVYLTAEGGDITNSGKIAAHNSNGNGGTIVLNGYGTASTGTVLNSGQLQAAG